MRVPFHFAGPQCLLGHGTSVACDEQNSGKMGKQMSIDDRWCTIVGDKHACEDDSVCACAVADAHHKGPNETIGLVFGGHWAQWVVSEMVLVQAHRNTGVPILADLQCERSPAMQSLKQQGACGHRQNWGRTIRRGSILGGTVQELCLLDLL